MFGLIYWLVKKLVYIAIALAIGFFVFVSLLPSTSSEVERADGIVALTGGAERLDAGMTLLESGHARRMLISGVAPETTREDLRARLGAGGATFDCCVDLDWAAQNTEGNAVETARWAHANGFRSLIVVTASYHMPRAMLELGAAAPDLDLHVYAVQPDSVVLDDWWEDEATLRLFASEYFKFLASVLRVGLSWLAGAVGA